ncbi:hypothetical protein AVEN_201413-1 [Araneus ventricosus]|uniref:CCHC-type domain-containing protein n=1 Tax=Araneus ventricosus TaxID=182803 RepID=A0A4Y2PNS6_ARAVE|nr:hypothetical protein AVEN_201413-1 [Araneus ventricosus]
MPRRKFNCSENYNKNRNNNNAYFTRSSTKEAWSPQSSDHSSSQNRQDSNEEQDRTLVGRRGQKFLQHGSISSDLSQENQSILSVVKTPQLKQQKLSKTSFTSDRFHSASQDELLKFSMADYETSSPASLNQKTCLTPLSPELRKAIQNKIDHVEESRSASYSEMREKFPMRFTNLMANLKNFADGALLPEKADSNIEVASFTNPISNFSPAGQSSSKLFSSTPSNVPKPKLATSSKAEQLNSKAKLRALQSLHSTSSSPPSPVLESNHLQPVQVNSPIPATSIPNVDFSSNFLSDTSDIEGAITEMSPIPKQELGDEEDLEVLFLKWKGKENISSTQQSTTESISKFSEDTCNLHEQVEKIKGFLSSKVPNVGHALNLLDQLQAEILANELINIKPYPQPQQMKNQTSKQVQTQTSQVSNQPPSSIPAVPSPNPTILLFPNSTSSGNLSDILNKELQPEEFNTTNIKPIKGNGLAISFKSNSDMINLQTKIVSNVNLKELIKSKSPAKTLPSLIVHNVPSSINEETLQEALKVQLHLSAPLNLRFKFRGTIQDRSNWVFEASASILQSTLKIQKLHIGWSMFKIKEFFHIKRCNFCHAFGHTTKDCTYQIPSCGSCAGHHATQDCLSQTICCVNCFESNLFTGTLHPTTHPAWDRQCPFYQIEKQQYCSSRDYN